MLKRFSENVKVDYLVWRFLLGDYRSVAIDEEWFHILRRHDYSLFVTDDTG